MMPSDTHILTLVAAQGNLTPAHVADVANYCDANGIGLAGVPAWGASQKVVALTVARRPARRDVEALWAILEPRRIDLFVTSAQSPRIGLMVADMDATIVTGETLDEIAALAGIGDQVAAITARAMRGELDFAAALRERVGMLRGRDESLLHEALAKMTLSPGAADLVRGLKARGATCVLVSGGFTFFTGAVAVRAGFDHHHGNVLETGGGRLAGTVAEPILGKEAKLSLLQQYAQQLKLESAQTLAIGDGANDLPMLQAAGLGIGYRPKPLLRQNLDNCLFYNDLSAILHIAGIA